MNGEYPELLADLADQVTSRLCDRGMTADDAKVIGRAVAEHVRKHWGGMLLYIPNGRAHELSQRDEEIWTRFDGKNHHELVREFKLSEQQIYQIIKKVGAVKRAHSQPDMFTGGVVSSAPSGSRP